MNASFLLGDDWELVHQLNELCFMMEQSGQQHLIHDTRAQTRLMLTYPCRRWQSNVRNGRLVPNPPTRQTRTQYFRKQDPDVDLQLQVVWMPLCIYCRLADNTTRLVQLSSIGHTRCKSDELVCSPHEPRCFRVLLSISIRKLRLVPCRVIHTINRCVCSCLAMMGDLLDAFGFFEVYQIPQYRNALAWSS
jgi:hypothetical protein